VQDPKVSDPDIAATSQLGSFVIWLRFAERRQ